MWYSYYTDSNGTMIKGKTFETLDAFKKYATKRPNVDFRVSNKEPDLNGRAYSANPCFER